jgi:hypothetical protein
LESLYPFTDQKLEWRSAAGVGRVYELHASRGIISQLEFTKKPTKEANGSTVAHHWNIRPDGPLGSKFHIRRGDDTAVFTTLQLNLAKTKGSLPIPGTSAKFTFASTNLFCTDWQWLDEQGYGLMGLRQKGLARMAADVYLADHAPQHPYTPMLLVVGFYLVYLNVERQAAQVALEPAAQLENLSRSLNEQRRRAKQRSINMLATK